MQSTSAASLGPEACRLPPNHRHRRISCLPSFLLANHCGYLPSPPMLAASFPVTALRVRGRLPPLVGEGRRRGLSANQLPLGMAAAIPRPIGRSASARGAAGWTRRRRRGAAGVLRACFNPLGDERILKEAMKEPVAFMGGVFAGLLRLDLNEDPLKEWITRTVEASGIAEENNTEESSEGSQNDAPQQIEIE